MSEINTQSGEIKRLTIKTFFKRSVVAAVVVSGALFSGCTTDPYTGQRQVSKGAIGAAIGAAVGAATSSKSDRKKGAAIGAIVGGGLGLYMDNQERQLRERLQGTGVSVTREGGNLWLNMPGNLTFEVNSANIRSNFYQVLESVFLVFKEFSKTQVQISGHTDSSGSDSYNQTLSEKRAVSVMNYFTAKGLPPSRFQAVGFGETRPIADNSTKQGRATNRRVEIQIIPVDGAY
jgi:outer membrane protein OmpA-like peptidoglycan-associated protein